MDKAKILRLLDEADDIVSALYRQGANKDYKCKSLREKLKAIATDISTPPKTNADCIRKMTDEEIADKLIDKCAVCVYHNAECETTFCICEEGVLKWLKQEVNTMNLNHISGCLDCIHPIDESEQCLIAKMFEKPVNPEHGCSWRIPIKRKDVLTNDAHICQMPDLMTKQDAVEYLLYMKHDVQAKSPMDIALDTAIKALKQSTIEPELRHGRWIVHTFGLIHSECSECKFDQNGDLSSWKFCPNCGAKMSEGAEIN